MSLSGRLAKLERAQGRGDGGADVTGTFREGTEDRPDAVKVWPGDLRMSVAEFQDRYPRGTLIVIADYRLPHYRQRAEAERERLAARRAGDETGGAP